MLSSSESLTSLLSWFNLWHNERQLEKQLIEHVVDTVEPKIRLAGNYQKQLREPVQVCMQYCKSMVATIPGPIYLKQNDFDADPCIHALFLASPIPIKELIEKQEISLIPDSSKEPERFALLTMAKKESSVFGPKTDGKMVIQDVQMTTVTFSDHKIVGLATSLEDSQNSMAHLCFEMILEAISRELASRRNNINELHEHMERLHAMSHIFANGGNAKSIFGHTTIDDQEKLHKVEQVLKETQNELVQERKGYETPDDWLSVLIEHLKVPEKMMHIQVNSLRLDWRNIITDSPDEQANDIPLAQCSFADEVKRYGVVISYSK